MTPLPAFHVHTSYIEAWGRIKVHFRLKPGSLKNGYSRWCVFISADRDGLAGRTQVHRRYWQDSHEQHLFFFKSFWIWGQCRIHGIHATENFTNKPSFVDLSEMNELLGVTHNTGSKLSLFCSIHYEQMQHAPVFPFKTGCNLCVLFTLEPDETYTHKACWRSRWGRRKRKNHYRCKPEVKIGLMQHPFGVNKTFISQPLEQIGNMEWNPIESLYLWLSLKIIVLHKRS